MDNGHKTGNGVSTAICGTAPVPAEEIEAICAQFGNDKHRMLDILREVQDRYRCIAPATMDHVAAATGLTRIEVEGVASFYSFLSLAPKGKVTIRLCDDIVDRLPVFLKRSLGSKSAKPATTVRFRWNTLLASACAIRRQPRWSTTSS